MTYDGFGRLRETTSSTGVVTKTYMMRIADLGDPEMAKGIPAAYAMMTKVGTLPASYALFDARDHTLRSITQGFDLSGAKQRPIQADVEYDAVGRVIRRSRAYDRGQPKLWVSTTYDALSRPLTVTGPDGSV